jgi:AcrR family transcriptional regulator
MTPRPQRTASSLIVPEVITAAVSLLGELGPDGFTVRSVARAAGVSPMSIYNHFGDKNGLVEAIWIEGFRELGEAITTSMKDLPAELVDGAVAYRNFALSHRAHYFVMFLHVFEGFEPSVRAVHEAAHAFESLIKAVESSQALGILSERRAADVAQMLWSAVHGYVSLEITSVNFASDSDRVFEDYAAALVRGLSVAQ